MNGGIQAIDNLYGYDVDHFSVMSMNVCTKFVSYFCCVVNLLVWFSTESNLISLQEHVNGAQHVFPSNLNRNFLVASA